MSRASSGHALLAEALQRDPAEVPLDASIENFPAWDSLAHMRLMVRLEEILGRELDTDEVLGVETIATIEALLNGAGR